MSSMPCYIGPKVDEKKIKRRNDKYEAEETTEIYSDCHDLRNTDWMGFS